MVCEQYQQDSTSHLSNVAFLDLPTEIHLLITAKLPYPDLLSLTLTHPKFYNHPCIRTSKTARVDWLIDRTIRRLPLPTASKCRWSSDREFVSNPEVVRFLRRRRLHLECAEVFSRGLSSGGCLVLDGCICPQLDESMEVLEDEDRTHIWNLAGFKKRAKSLRSRHYDNIAAILTSWRMAVSVLVIAIFVHVTV